LRGHLAEYGLVAQVQRTGLKQLIEIVIDDEDERIHARLKPLLMMLVDDIGAADIRIAELDRRMRMGPAITRPAVAWSKSPVWDR